MNKNTPSIFANRKRKSAVEKTAQYIFTGCGFLAILAVLSITAYTVSYTHLDVYKRQGMNMVVDMTPEGEPVIQRTVVDITQRQQLQRQLEQEQEMYRVAMESSTDTMFEYLMASDTFISYEPRSGGGVVRRELAHYSELMEDEKFVHPEDAQAVIDNICNGQAEVLSLIHI